MLYDPTHYRAVIERYLGPGRRAGQSHVVPHADRYEDALARTRFGRPQIMFCPGRPDIVQDSDGDTTILLARKPA